MAFYPEDFVPDLTRQQVLEFLLFLYNERQLAASTVNQAIHSLRTYYQEHLGLKWRIWNKVKLKRVEPLPHVLTRSEVDLLLRSFRDGRYRAFFTVMYQCGLRLTETINIKPKDIDGKRLVIRIRVTKGGEERDVPITPELLQRLRAFWKWHRNPDWLFPAPGRGWIQVGQTLQQALECARQPMGSAAINAALKQTKYECGLMKKHEKVSCHTLRHSFATHMLEGGCSVRQVSAYLGHKSLKPTLVYLHLTEVSETAGRIALTTLATGQR